jgi:hypothetical protein
MSDQLHLNAVGGLCCSVGVAPVSLWNSVDCTVFGAALRIRAVFRVPFGAAEAIIVPVDVVDPSPVRIESDSALFDLATGISTLRVGEGNVILLFL